METIKVQNIKNPKGIKEIPKELLDDYLGTNEWKIYVKPIEVSTIKVK